MEEKTIGYVHSIETFGSVDGPGLRFVVFMQGRRMRCQFCHNPDTWNIGGGKEYTADELLDKALETASLIASKSQLTTSMIKEQINVVYETSLSQGLLFERRTFHALF